MIRFVGTNSDGLPLKRKQSQRACEVCRRRKKRCNHSDGSLRGEGGANNNLLPADGSASGPAGRPVVSDKQPHVVGTDVRQEDEDHTPLMSSEQTNARSIGDEHDDRDTSRFVGDLNPEGIFLAATSPESLRSPTQGDSVGVWLPRRRTDQVRATDLVSHGPSNASPVHLDSIVSRGLPSRVDEPNLHLLPDTHCFEKLQSIYLREVHPLYPVIDLQAFGQMHDDSAAKLILKQSICLAASTSPRSREFLSLCLSDSATPKLCLPKEFADRISFTIHTTVNTGLIKDRLVLTQVLSLLSMFTQFSDDRHSSAELAARAISYSQTVGIHIKTAATIDDNVYITRLFCCVYTLDRLNAVFHGRPLMIHDRDVERDIQASFEQQEGGFQLLLHVILLLDKVIGLYRPGVDSVTLSSKLEFPAFEDLLNKSGALRVPAQLLATIETLYHATAMLSNRSQSLNETSRSSPSHLRQSLSAASINSIVGDEFRGQLSLLPFVPYAMSLSLRVFYRELRLSRSSFMRARARRQLLQTCETLRGLGHVFTTSMLMVGMAEQTVQEMDKVSTSMRTQQRSTVMTATTEPLATADDDHENNPSQDHAVNNDVVLRAAVTGTDVCGLPPNTDSQFDHGIYDPTIFGDIPDLDIFDHFDPDFELGVVDAALANSIDPSYPTSLIDFARLI